jgi:hypothetical protein
LIGVVKLEEQVSAWIDRWALAELAQTGYAQVDIDDLLDPVPARAARAMLDCMAFALTAVQAAKGPHAAFVVIPLPAAEEQPAPPTDHPTLADLLQADWVYGPGRQVPGLYLLGPGSVTVDDEVEEYRIGLAAPATDVRAYYRAWRTLDGRERYPGEWSRELCVHAR